MLQEAASGEELGNCCQECLKTVKFKALVVHQMQRRCVMMYACILTHLWSVTVQVSHHDKNIHNFLLTYTNES